MDITMELNSPITEEQWDILEDVDLDNTESICFHTKHGKEVEFVKRKRGEWLDISVYDDPKAKVIEQWQSAKCSVCGKYHTTPYLYGFEEYKYCPNCGARMRKRGEKRNEQT